MLSPHSAALRSSLIFASFRDKPHKSPRKQLILIPRIPSPLSLAIAICLTGTSLAELPVEFNRDVRPLLTKNCTTCHGGVMKAGGVSFLYREDVLGNGESGLPVVVTGHPEKSEMIARIISTEDVVRMPPPEKAPKSPKKPQGL